MEYLNQAKTRFMAYFRLEPGRISMRKHSEFSSKRGGGVYIQMAWR